MRRRVSSKAGNGTSGEFRYDVGLVFMYDHFGSLFIGAKGGDSCEMMCAGRYTAGAKVTRRIGVRPAESVRP